MITDSQYDCPVCKASHPSGVRLSGLAVLACDKLTPVGETRFFPKYGVIVVGGGEGVDSLPPKPVSVPDLQSRLAALEAEKRVRGEAKDQPKADDLQARIAQLEKELQA